MEPIFIIEMLALLLGLIGGVVIIWGSFVTSGHFLQCVVGFHSHGKQVQCASMDSLRLELGRYIVLGLEFFIGKDILETIFVPTWNEIGMLAALIAIRTTLSYFLVKEIHMIDQRDIYRMQVRTRKK